MSFPITGQTPYGPDLQQYIDAGDTTRIGVGVVGQIGASITNNGTLSYYDKTLSGCVSYGALSPMGFALPRTKGRWTAGGVAATNGITTQQMIDNHLPSVLLSNWTHCIVGEPTNDLGNGVALSDTKAHITTIIEGLLNSLKQPILTTCPPNDAYASGAGLTWITQYNEWIKSEARRRKLTIVDYHSVLVDPATNAYRAGFSSDGTHPSANGANVMGQALADVFNAVPGPVRQPLESSYNPNMLAPDAVYTSVGADKAVGSGNTTGGFAFGVQTSTKWKGNSPTIVRGSVGNYQISWPITAGAMIAGHRVRVAFGFSVPGLTVGSGTWSAYLYNLTQSQVVCGYSAVTHTVNDGTETLAVDGAVAATNVVTCATSKPFRPSMVGNVIQVYSGVTARFAAGTTIIGVSADGTQAYLSAATATTASAQTVVVQGQPQISCFEFDVQPDMVGDSFAFIVLAGGATATAIAASQISIADLTALGVG